MKPRALFTALLISASLGLAVRFAPTPARAADPVNVAWSARKCTDAGGRILYIVENSGRVTDGSGKMLGTIKPNGDVLNASGKLIAKYGDPGVLLCH